MKFSLNQWENLNGIFFGTEEVTILVIYMFGRLKTGFTGSFVAEVLLSRLFILP
jgi:hypothetical protein